MWILRVYKISENERKYKVEHVHDDHEDTDMDDHTKRKVINKISQMVNEVTDKGYQDKAEYCHENGHHFNLKAAKFAISNMVSADGRDYKIKLDKVLELMRQDGIELPDGVTEGDVLYLSNKIRHSHSTDTVKSDTHCIRLALECVEDPNKEEGEIFVEWVERMKRKNHDIPWHTF